MCVCVCVWHARACIRACVYAVYIIVVMISQYYKNVYRFCDQLLVQVYGAQFIPIATLSGIYRHKSFGRDRKTHTNNIKETLQTNKNG